MAGKHLFNLSKENIKGRWRWLSFAASEDQETAIERMIAERESYYTSGTRDIGDFRFRFSDGMAPELYIGPYSLRFSELGWFRFMHTFGLRPSFLRKIVREGGATGVRYVESLLNDFLAGKHGAKAQPMELMLFRHKDEENVFTIREMLREKDRKPMPHKELVDHALSIAKRLGDAGADPVGFALRFSDYADGVRIFLRLDSQQPAEPARVGIDLLWIGFHRTLVMRPFFAAEFHVAAVSNLRMRAKADKDIPALLAKADELIPYMVDVDKRIAALDAQGAHLKETHNIGALIAICRTRRVPAYLRNLILADPYVYGEQTPDSKAVIGALVNAAESSRFPDDHTRLERAYFDFLTTRNTCPMNERDIELEELVRKGLYPPVASPEPQEPEEG